MAVTLNRTAFEYGKELIHEYAKWHLGIDEDEAENAKGCYKSVRRLCCRSTLRSTYRGKQSWTVQVFRSGKGGRAFARHD
jgi:hypothetical protein